MLNATAYQILVGLGLLLVVLSLIKLNPYLPLIALVLVCSALLAGKAK